MIIKSIKKAIEHELHEKIYENYEKEIEELGIWNVEGTMKLVDTEVAETSYSLKDLQNILSDVRDLKTKIKEMQEKHNLDMYHKQIESIKDNITTLESELEFDEIHYEVEEVNTYKIQGTAEVSCEYEEDNEYMIDEFKIKFSGELKEEEGLKETYSLEMDYKEED